jgi:drug/metabolite transporter (DMT)-like permease
LLTGTIGFVLLWRRREHLKSHDLLGFNEWLAVFICFFWSRQVLNPIIYVLNKLSRHTTELMGDEVYLALKLHLPELSISLLTGLICFWLLSFVVVKFIPTTQRFTFLLAGITGSALGFILWFACIGKVLMP